MVHRLGKMQQGGPKERPRVTIMQFSVRSYRDAIWKAAKNSSYLKESGLRFMEDFSAGERERRKKKSCGPRFKKHVRMGRRPFLSEAELTFKDREKLSCIHKVPSDF